MILDLKVTQTTQNFLVNKRKIRKMKLVKKENLILKKAKKDSKIEVDLNHLNLKNIIEEEIKYFFWVQLFLFSK